MHCCRVSGQGTGRRVRSALRQPAAKEVDQEWRACAVCMREQVSQVAEKGTDNKMYVDVQVYVVIHT